MNQLRRQHSMRNSIFLKRKNNYVNVYSVIREQFSRISISFVATAFILKLIYEQPLNDICSKSILKNAVTFSRQI